MVNAYRVYLMNQAPAIGSGNRTVVVEQEGRLWVKLIEPYTLQTATLRRDVWADIARKATPLELKPSRVSRLTRERIDAYASGFKYCCTEKEEQGLKTKIAGLQKKRRRVLAALKQAETSA